MTRNEAKDYIKGKLREYLEMKNIDIRKKFRCLNPEHEDSDPSMSFDRKRDKAHCFGCDADYDIFDLIAIDFNLKSGKEIFEQAYRIFNIDVEGLRPSKYDKPVIPPVRPDVTSRPSVPSGTAADIASYMPIYRKLFNRDCDYLQKRGISRETAMRFGIGYAPKGGVIPWPAVVIPTGGGSFVARNVDPGADQANRYRKLGHSEIFNFEATRSGKGRPCFVVEGEIDAMSVEEAGFPAVGLGSIANMNKFLDRVRAEPPTSTLIILLDRNARGEQAAEILSEELTAINLPHFGTSEGVFIPEGYQDPSDFLQGDPVRFKAFLDEASQMHWLTQSLRRISTDDEGPSWPSFMVL